jgi:ABC-type nitrate/sulfonate/bicarbonate transport system ATPase subunit
MAADTTRNAEVFSDLAPAPSSEPVVVSLENVGYVYPNGTVALEDISMELRQSEVLGIVGPSGCGKSTLLQLVAGLARPTSGAVTEQLERERGVPISMVFQTDTLLPWLKVKDNVLLYTKFRRFGLVGTKRERQERATQLLEMVGIAKFSDNYPYQLSGGMRRRLAFLAGVAPEPSLLLLDEPFASVDEPTRVRIHQDVIRIVRSLGMTVVLVTHDLAEALSLSDRVVILSKHPGRVFTEHVIPFGLDRNVIELRQTEQFLDLYGRMWADLSSQI